MTSTPTETPPETTRPRFGQHAPQPPGLTAPLPAAVAQPTSAVQPGLLVDGLDPNDIRRQAAAYGAPPPVLDLIDVLLQRLQANSRTMQRQQGRLLDLERDLRQREEDERERQREWRRAHPDAPLR